MINKLLAGDAIPIAPDGGFRGPGIGSLPGGSDTAAGVFDSIISTVVGVFTVVGFVWFVILFMLGAVGIITSGGDKVALESARKKITTGIIGVVVVIAAVLLIDLIGVIIGVDILGGASVVTRLVP